MNIARNLALSTLLLLAGFYGAINLLLVKIPVGMVGVRTQEYSLFSEKGVVDESFQPGWHRDFGPFHSWVTFDSTVQTLEMTKDHTRGDRYGKDDVRVQSADGYAISVDVTVKYRIMADMAHKLYQNTGSGVKYKKIVRNTSERFCIGKFGQMKTEEFYNPEIRRIKTQQVKEELEKDLADNFIEVIDVLIRNVEFDVDYEEKIRKKKLADQDVELNISLAEAAEMAGKRQVIEATTQRKIHIIRKELESEKLTMEAETNKQIALIKAKYEKYNTEKQADGDLVYEQRKAEGELLLKKSEAEGERLRNEAMQGVGGSVIVALEAAKNLNFSNVSISTLQTDLLDLNEMIEKLGVSTP